MIIVTGTKRSGTSMWMQILQAAGYAILGERFPRDWGETIRAANPRGFFESRFRHGIYYGTNPDRETGVYLHPSDTRRTAVKVFATGLMRTDLAFADHVLVTVRSPSEYQASIERLYAMERESKLARARARGREASSWLEVLHMPPALEWWHDNYRVLRDATLRRYRVRFISYDRVLRAPLESVERVLAWLGGGDLDAATREVRATLRTQRRDALGESSALPEAFPERAVMDELHARVDAEVPLDSAFWARLEATQRVLWPRIRAAEERVRENRKRRSLRSGHIRSRAARAEAASLGP